MSAVGFDRTPREVARRLDDVLANARTMASLLGQAIDGSPTALDDLASTRQRARLAAHQLTDATGRSRRLGADRIPLLDTATAIDEICETVDALAWLWTRAPNATTADAVLQVRDLVRLALAAAAGAARVSDVAPHVRRARTALRQARAVVLLHETDLSAAVTEAAALDRAERTVVACARLEHIRASAAVAG